MTKNFAHPLSTSLLLLTACSASLLGQVTSPPGMVVPPPSKLIEPGLENAVKWTWRVVPPADDRWGRLMAEIRAASAPAVSPNGSGTPGVPGAPGEAAPAMSPPRPQEYTVEKGDAIAKIARKFSMSSDQLKTANGLTSDVIRIGQTLKIPTLEELKAMVPPPPPKPAEGTAEAKKGGKPAAPKPMPVYGLQAQQEYVNVLLQVYMDREGFSCGYIDGKSGPVFQKLVELFLTSHDGLTDQTSLVERARSVLGDPFTTYQLRPDDLRFIMAGPTGVGTTAAAPKRPAASGKSGAKGPVEPDLTYRDLVGPPLLLYRSAWELVAERFHCDEGFLRRMNSKIKSTPVVGTTFRVPNVFPFEIEHAMEGSLQPIADTSEPVTASIIALTRLQIYKGGRLVSVMPVASARPGLRGRNFWTVLDAIPAPRLATLQEDRDPPKAPASPVISIGAASIPTPEAAPPKAKLEEEQFLGSGPNNPVGVVWINLARGKGAEPLPFGLHGTSIPAKMNSQEGLGGFRLTNWDIVRAVKLMPAGTQLEWKEN
ncbi:LysM peptidoglycan-binding domain-containing protein [Verrucomicrobium sp. BvORR034]|uniref:LysM peptidoglycan-binding domain-containing protein n=1 Tax=Verrucomicrobium sp. BvORR034 TaxID=1396418 RepID=UPI0006797875|nr:LysM peptidoglycan-binding domain-containing protein [Verrucomicrobium sp. BvORR034]